MKTWLQFPKWFYDSLPVNTLTAPRLTRVGWPRSTPRWGGITTSRPIRRSSSRCRSLTPPYLGFQLGSLWYISLDYINHQTSLNGTQAQADPDGKIRIVVADKNPGVTNWVETLGHAKGYLQFRWQRVSRELTEADGPPTMEIVDLDAVAAKLPYYEQNKISEDDWRERIALRQKLIGNRMVG